MTLRPNSRVIILRSLQVCRVIATKGTEVRVDSILAGIVDPSEIRLLPDVDKEICSMCKVDCNGYDRYAANDNGEGIMCWYCYGLTNLGQRPRRDAMNSAFSGGCFEQNRRKH